MTFVEKDPELERFLAAEGQGEKDVAYLDVWTSETDEHVQRMRARGVHTTCLADLILERWPRTVGVTGTAGKTTTSWLIRQLVGGRSSLARADNLWPTSELLNAGADELLVLELTSSHLAFCHHSPRVAVVTNFWPDHLELHGGLARYRDAKARLFRFQRPDDLAVLPCDDPEAAALADESPAQRVYYGDGGDVFCEGSSVVVGGAAFREGPQLVSRGDATSESSELGFGGSRLELGSFPGPLREGNGLRCLLAALATAWALGGGGRAFGSGASALGRGDRPAPPLQLELPPHRRRVYGRAIDDTLAATPRKAMAGLMPGTALVAGGMLSIAGRRVHSYPEEQPALEQWLALIRERCPSVDLFGEAGTWLQARVGGTLHGGVLEALAAAAARDDGRVLVSPGFPMTQEDRQAVADWLVASE